MRLTSLYVGVTDMQRSVDFYKRIFQSEPVKRNEHYTGFDLGGMQFGLIDTKAYRTTLRVGNNCVPTIQVDDISAEFARIKTIAPAISSDIHSIDQYFLFDFADPDGNIIEFFSLVPPGLLPE